MGDEAPVPDHGRSRQSGCQKIDLSGDVCPVTTYRALVRSTLAHTFPRYLQGPMERSVGTPVAQEHKETSEP